MRILEPRILKHWSLLIGVLLTVAVIASGCGGDDADSEIDSTDGGSANVVVEVVQGGTVLAGFVETDLHGLPQVTVETGGREMEGSTVRSVLAAAGVEAFETVKVDGFRGVKAGDLTLTSAELDDQVILVLNSRGEAKLVSPAIPPEKWIGVVKRLVVE